MTDKSNKRAITIGEIISRQKKGLPPFPSEDEFKSSESHHNSNFFAEHQEEPMKEDSNQLTSLRGLVQKLTKDLRAINENDTSSTSDMFSAFGNAFHSLKDIPDEEMQIVATNLPKVIEPVAKAFGVQSRVDEIITVGSVVVTYRPNLMNMKDDQRKKIRDAITAV